MMQLTPEQAVEYVCKGIEQDFNYFKRNQSSFETTTLPPEVISEICTIWESKGYRMLDPIEDKNGRHFNPKLKVWMDLPNTKTRSWAVVEKVDGSAAAIS